MKYTLQEILNIYSVLDELGLKHKTEGSGCYYTITTDERQYCLDKSGFDSSEFMENCFTLESLIEDLDSLMIEHREKQKLTLEQKKIIEKREKDLTKLRNLKADYLCRIDGNLICLNNNQFQIEYANGEVGYYNVHQINVLLDSIYARS